MSRRCVVCGKEATEDTKDFAYHYPKNRKEARIWQQSMAAHHVPVRSIEKFCCVCIEHIPQFVERTQKQASLIKGNLKKKSKKPKTPCTTPLGPSTPQVLLLRGAAPCLDNLKVDADGQESNETQDGSDEDIVIRESTFVDSASNAPQNEETEVTVLRTPTKKDEELQNPEENNQEDVTNLHNCTDVLLLSRTEQDATDKRLCNCASCSQMTSSGNALEPLQLHNIGSYGVQCECQIRVQLSGIIKQQQQRITELEALLSQQNVWYSRLQQKMDELYSDLGRLDREKAIIWSVPCSPEQTRHLALRNSRSTPICMPQQPRISR